MVELRPRSRAWRKGLAIVGLAAAVAMPAAVFGFQPEPEPEAAPSTEVAPAADAAENQAGGGTRTIFDGVYTDAQANAGQGLYTTDCSGCHGADGWGGAMGPEAIGYALDSIYADRPLFEYFDFIRNNMPLGAPGRFSDDQYIDIVAYLLKLHGAPAGETELDVDEETLRDITIVPTP